MIGAAWKKISGQNSGIDRLDPTRIEFVTFEVMDSGTADKIRAWISRDEQAAAVREKYLADIVPHYLRRVPLMYRADLEGRIESINYTGCVPEGWAAIGVNTHWLAPESNEAKKATASLPTSSRRALHDLIGWPTLSTDYIKKSEHRLVHQLNHLVRPYEADGKVYVDVPHYDNYRELSLPVYNALTAWVPPEDLREIVKPRLSLVGNILEILRR